MSCINPLFEPTVIDLARPMVSVLTPTVKLSVKLTIELVNPDMFTVVSSFNSINGKNVASTSSPLFHSNVAPSNGTIVVSILDIPIPTISSTRARNPEPFVPSSSNSVKSPTLYPLPPFKMVNPSTSPLVTDSIFETCLIFS